MGRKAKSRRPLRPKLAKTRALAIALWVLSAVLGCLAILDFTFRAQGNTSDSDDLSLVNPLTWGPDVWSLMLLAVLTPFWLARVHRNAETLSGAYITGSPAWTAGIWFVPILGGLFAGSALRRVWTHSGAPRSRVPQVWAILWSIAQVVLVVALVALVSAYVDAARDMGGPPFTPQEEDVLSDVGDAVLRPFVLVLDVLMFFGAACMVLAVRDLEVAQHRRTAPAAGNR